MRIGDGIAQCPDRAFAHPRGAVMRHYAVAPEWLSFIVLYTAFRKLTGNRPPPDIPSGAVLVNSMHVTLLAESTNQECP